MAAQLAQPTMNQITERAAKDADFRRELLADPKGVLARELGLTLPAALEVRVVEESPSTIYLVLPPAPVTAGSELSEEQLEAVAGGCNKTLQL